MAKRAKSSLLIFVLILGILYSLGVVSPDFYFKNADASSPFDITFPIPELENCASQEECRVYCDDLNHKDVCLSFAEKHGFISKGEEEKFKKLPTVGPGGCQGEEECRAFCENPDNQDECFNFAKDHGLIDKEEIRRFEKFNKIKIGECRGFEECHKFCGDPRNARACLEISEKEGLLDEKEAKAFEAIIEEGGPGGCKSLEECEQFCANPENIETCLNFAKEHKFISGEEVLEIRSSASLIGPGGCRGEECRAFCEAPEHQEECLNFAEEQGFMSKEEAGRARQAMEAMRTGGPGGCRGPEECRVYCENSEHIDECAEFGEKHKLINKEEVRQAREFSRVMREEGGPGGCRGQEECRNYCESEERMDECFEFGKKKGFIRDEDVKNFERSKSINKRMKEVGGPGGCKSENDCRVYCQESTHAEECLAFAVEQGGIPPEEAKMMLENFTRESGKHEFGSRQPKPEEFKRFENERFKRFEEFRGLEKQFRSPAGTSMPMMEFQGPGGCKSPEECIKFCSDPANRDVCAHFGPPSGGPPPGEIFRQVPSGSESEFRMPQPFNTASPLSPDLIKPQYPEFLPPPQLKPFRFGPGGCASEAECKAYCSDPARAVECGIPAPTIPQLENTSSPQSVITKIMSAILNVILPGFRY